jgi:transketolase
MRKAFADTMLEVGKEDKRLVVVVGDISHGLFKEYNQICEGRYFNIGILEPTIISMTAGMNQTGLIPVAHTIAPFLIERSFEQIKLDYCYQERSGNLVSVGSAFDYAGLGCSHHCYNDLAMIKSLPRTQVFYPASFNEFRFLFKKVYDAEKLNYFRLPGQMHESVFSESEIKPGKAINARIGSDATIVATGPHLKTALLASKNLQFQHKIECDVLYFHTLKPFDSETLLKSLDKTKRVIVIEEHSQFGGFGDEVLRFGSHLNNIKYNFINIQDSFIRGYGSYEDHCRKLGFTESHLQNQILKMVQ